MQLFAPLLRPLGRFGVDRAVAFSLLSRVWFAGAGVLSLLLLVRFLSKEEQGFYYTFTSILGLQIFFELGLSYVVLQFASYEKAHLEWSAGGTLEGEAQSKERLSSLLRLGVKWYAIVALLMVVLVFPIGYWFFATHQPPGPRLVWQGPWLWVVIISSGTLLLAPLFAVIQGCGLIAEVALVRFYQTVAGSVLFWLSLLLHWRLASAPVAITVAFFWSLVWLGTKQRAFLLDLWRTPSQTHIIGWKTEVWPLQWKIAVSWMSGYFIFQLFNPILVGFHHVVEAGQMGLSITAMNALVAVASVWIETKLAPFGNLIALRQFKELDALFFSSLWQAFAVVCTGGAAFWLTAWFLHIGNNSLSQRLLAPFPLGLLIVTTLLNFLVGAQAAYLRAWKQEPFLWLSVLIGVLAALSTYFGCRYFGVEGMMIGNFLITAFVGLGGGSYIFQTKRRLWQRQGGALNT